MPGLATIEAQFFQNTHSGLYLRCLKYTGNACFGHTGNVWPGHTDPILHSTYYSLNSCCRELMITHFDSTEI